MICVHCGVETDDVVPAQRFDWSVIEGSFYCRDKEACLVRRDATDQARLDQERAARTARAGLDTQEGDAR